MRKKLIQFSLMTVFIFCLGFAEFSVDKYYFEPFVGQDNAGMRINPVLTGLKGKLPNQEMNLNFIVYYHNKYDLKEDQVLGRVDGRLISETPLSSFDPLKQIREDKRLAISNYGARFKEYQEALNQFREFQDKVQAGEIDTDTVETIAPEQNVPATEEYYYYYDEAGTPVPAVEGGGDALNYYQQYLNSKAPLFKVEQMFVAQDVKNTNLSSFPTMSYTNREISSTNLSAKELEFLIRYERLKKAYNEAIELYNSAIRQDKENKEYFDPADPNEEFGILFVGLENNTMWAKKFKLNGTTRYQSYNPQVWYLGYELDITKKDLRVLYNLFSKNKKINYVVQGVKGQISFALDSQFIMAVHDLLDVYVRGGFYTQTDTEFPMMRPRDE